MGPAIVRFSGKRTATSECGVIHLGGTHFQVFAKGMEVIRMIFAARSVVKTLRYIRGAYI